jgi:hypothetical protein
VTHRRERTKAFAKIRSPRRRFTRPSESLGSAERVILKSKIAHLLRRIEISAVDNEASRHERLGAFPVQVAKNVPLRTNQRSIRAAQRVVGVFVVGHFREERLGSRYRLRIGGMHVRAFLQQAPNHFERRRKPNVVRVGFEREPQHRDVFALHDPESVRCAAC